MPWGTGIETGYSAEPQLYKKVNGKFDETKNFASENPAMLKVMQDILENIRNNRNFWIEN